MEFRSMFSNIFGGKKQQEQQTYTKMEMLNSYNPVFTSFGNDIFADELVRSCIHAIATHAGKLKARHMGFPNSRIEYLLQTRPNHYMSAFDMIYKTITQLYINNNAYTLIQRDNGGSISGFYPINASSTEFLEYQNSIYVQFTFWNGKKVTVPYDEVVHLRRHFNKNDMFGDSNDAIINTLDLLNTVNQGVSNAIKSSHRLKGILKVTGSLKPEALKEVKDTFIADYMNLNNVGGVAATDSKMEYIPIIQDSKFLEAEEMTVIEEKIFKYFNINKKIIMSEFDENTWNAFYEGVVEPIAIQLSLEFTAKCFTDRERGFGNRIEFSANRLNYASNTTKVAMIKELLPYSVFTINEARELFNLEPVEGGDNRVQTLNVVQADKANLYQVGEGEEEDGNE